MTRGSGLTADVMLRVRLGRSPREAEHTVCACGDADQRNWPRQWWRPRPPRLPSARWSPGKLVVRTQPDPGVTGQVLSHGAPQVCLAEVFI